MNEKVEDIISNNGYLITQPLGNSMLPLIRPDIDTVVIKKRIPKKYDVVLYKRSNGKYILHRVLKISNKGYDICGDNQWKIEFGIIDKQILGVMDGFYRGNKYIDISSFWYKLYIRFWCGSLYFRKIIIYILRVFNSLRKINDGKK